MAADAVDAHAARVDELISAGGAPTATSSARPATGRRGRKAPPSAPSDSGAAPSSADTAVTPDHAASTSVPAATAGRRQKPLSMVPLEADAVPAAPKSRGRRAAAAAGGPSSQPSDDSSPVAGEAGPATRGAARLRQRLPASATPDSAAAAAAMADALAAAVAPQNKQPRSRSRAVRQPEASNAPGDAEAGAGPASEASSPSLVKQAAGKALDALRRRAAARSQAASATGEDASRQASSSASRAGMPTAGRCSRGEPPADRSYQHEGRSSNGAGAAHSSGERTGSRDANRGAIGRSRSAGGRWSADDGVTTSRTPRAGGDLGSNNADLGSRGAASHPSSSRPSARQRTWERREAREAPGGDVPPSQRPGSRHAGNSAAAEKRYTGGRKAVGRQPLFAASSEGSDAKRAAEGDTDAPSTSAMRSGMSAGEGPAGRRQHRAAAADRDDASSLGRGDRYEQYSSIKDIMRPPLPSGPLPPPARLALLRLPSQAKRMRLFTRTFAPNIETLLQRRQDSIRRQFLSRRTDQPSSSTSAPEAASGALAAGVAAAALHAAAPVKQPDTSAVPAADSAASSGPAEPAPQPARKSQEELYRERLAAIAAQPAAGTADAAKPLRSMLLARQPPRAVDAGEPDNAAVMAHKELLKEQLGVVLKVRGGIG